MKRVTATAKLAINIILDTVRANILSRTLKQNRGILMRSATNVYMKSATPITIATSLKWQCFIICGGTFRIVRDMVV